MPAYFFFCDSLILLLSSSVTLILNIFFVVLYYIPKAAITPCTIGIPVFVMLNTMSSYVYRNTRFGYYRDYSITSSVINDAVVHQRRDIVFKISTSVKQLDSERDLESGGVNQSEEEFVEDVSSRNSKVETEKIHA